MQQLPDHWLWAVPGWKPARGQQKSSACNSSCMFVAMLFVDKSTQRMPKWVLKCIFPYVYDYSSHSICFRSLQQWTCNCCTITTVFCYRAFAFKLLHSSRMMLAHLQCLLSLHCYMQPVVYCNNWSPRCNLCSCIRGQMRVDIALFRFLHHQ